MPEERTPEEIKAAMDKAAEDAAKALKKLDKKAVEAVATWMKGFVSTAGYKRLGRVLTATIAAPKKAAKSEENE
mgnify:CR=1 FL=1